MPCGIREYEVTSLDRELRRPIQTAELIGPVVRGFAEVFGGPCDMPKADLDGLPEGVRRILGPALDASRPLC